MVRARRTKRASEDDLYRDCRQGRDCAPDIKNKYEHNTIADRILKWASQFLWFGQLGIGTGRGTGGRGGYTPLGGGGGGDRGLPNVIGRPPVVVDSVGPEIVTPIDAVDPTASSVVPLEEGTGGTDLPTGDIEVIAETTPTLTNGDPDAVVIGEGDAAPPTIEVTVEPAPGGPRRNANVSQSTYTNPAFEAVVLSPQLPGESSVTEQVFVNSGIRGEFVGGLPEQEIELSTFSEVEGFGDMEIEEPPRSSTPNTGLGARLSQNFRNIRRDLYNRRVSQVNVENRRFLSSPRAFVEFEYENPAFEGDVSLEFNRNLQEVQEAPDYNFRDIIRLGRPRYSVTESGHVRFSRLGTRGTIVTRSGTVIGGTTHYYTDLSEIPPEEMELTVIGNPMEEAAIIQSDTGGTMVGAETAESAADIEQALLDIHEEDFSNTRLILTNGDSEFSVPSIFDESIRGPVSDYTGEVVYPPETTESNIPPAAYPLTPLDYPVTPIITLNIVDDTLLLDPSLFGRRKRKRGHKHFVLIF